MASTSGTYARAVLGRFASGLDDLDVSLLCPSLDVVNGPETRVTTTKTPRNILLCRPFLDSSAKPFSLE